MKIQNFDASTVPLAGGNLIEASAGTGKTYSIAIMVLRLVLEKKISIKEILMVTFTKAAVAELEERIRLFIRQAHKASLGFVISDLTILGLVERAIKKTSKEEVQQQLKDAVLFLDETSVLTIHSFCQQTLTEFAFETNQLFGSETLKDMVSLIETEVNKFWRENITTMNVELLGQLIEHRLSRADIVSVIREHISGKKYFEYDENESYSICDEDQRSFSKTIKELAEKDKEIKECVYDHIRDNTDRLKSITEANKWAKMSLLRLIDTPAEFVDVVISKRGTGYIDKLYGDIIAQHGECDNLVEERNELVQTVINKIYCHAIGTVTKAIDQYKHRNSLLGFDDMIVNLHKAIVHDNNKNLICSLQEKYKAVFVDEFQDTDKLQYEIFHTTFASGENILFYIGDPKQSIYAWRKADIFTYFKASDEVDNKYGMNVNYRSSAPFIRAMNLFFKPSDDFDTFYFREQEHSIDYINVESPADNKGVLLFNGVQDVPITIYGNKDNSQIAETVTAKIIDLLENENYTIEQKGIARRIRPSDIGILVRKNKQAVAVKACLAKRGIPAVTIDDSKILQSEEAIYVLYLLEALIDLNRSAINKALLSPFTGYDTKAVLALNEETVLNDFREYKNIWDKDGVYSVLMKFVSDYQVRSLLLNHHTENGERIIANLFHVIEVLHKVQSEKQFSALELVSWLKRGIDGMQTEGDEFEQRVESDEEAVKIVTLHKSKGLEYNIVFAPYLDLDTKIHFRFCSFRDTETGDYIFADSEQLNPEQQQVVDEQTEQENRRLIYVAITRAVYKCYINKSFANYYKDSSLVPFITSIKGVDPTLVHFEESPTIPEKYYYSKADELIATNDTRVVNFQLLQVNWRKMSYTSLAATHTNTPKNNSNPAAGEYERFIFKQLAKGTKTGNLLHQIFENIDFTNGSYWSYKVQDALKKFQPKHSGEWTPMLLQLMKHVTTAKIEVADQCFTLADIPDEKRLNELEFDFNVPVFNPSDLNTIDQDDTQVNVKYYDSLEGIMNGKIDLFFEHNGKYYILDWKSNFLGDSLEFYKKEQLSAAMSENNYHLQYLLYTVAVKKYLEARLSGFNYAEHFGGVIYLFVRGVRGGDDSGVFTHRPNFAGIKMLESLLS
jgi:exodeoxyribonuclease V beta subunit